MAALVGVDPDSGDAMVMDDGGFAMVRRGGVWRDGVVSADELMDKFERVSDSQASMLLKEARAAASSAKPNQRPLRTYSLPPPPTETPEQRQRRSERLAHALKGFEEGKGPPYPSPQESMSDEELEYFRRRASDLSLRPKHELEQQRRLDNKNKK